MDNDKYSLRYILHLPFVLFLSFSSRQSFTGRFDKTRFLKMANCIVKQPIDPNTFAELFKRASDYGTRISELALAFQSVH